MRRTILLAATLMAAPVLAQQPVVTRAGEVAVSLSPAEIQLIVKGLDTETRNGGLAVAVNTVPLAQKLAAASQQQPHQQEDARQHGRQGRTAPPQPPAQNTP